MRYFLFTVFGLQLFLSQQALSRTEIDSSLEWNRINIAALAVIGCGLYSDKSETVQYHDQFLFHHLKFGKDPKTGHLLVTGDCGKPLDANKKMQKGAEFRLDIDAAQFNQVSNPVVMGFIGDWGFKLYFKSLTKFNGQKLDVIKILEQVSFFHIGPPAARILLTGVGLLPLAWSGSESLSPMKFGMSGSWSHADGTVLDLEGLGARNAESIRIWSFENKILMNASDLVSYWGRGAGRPTGEKGDAIFFPRFDSASLSNEWIGCSYFVEYNHIPVDERTCRQLWIESQ